MTSLNMNDDFFLIVMIAAVGILILEAVLAGTWNRFYFTFGLPLFIKRIPVNLFSFPPLDYARLQAEFSANWVNKSLVFKELDVDKIAFREKLLEMRWGRSSSEVMHGLLVLDQNSQHVAVIGYANWWLLGLTALALALLLSLGSNGLLFAGFYLILIGVVYFLQARRFSKVAQAVAAQVMEKK